MTRVKHGGCDNFRPHPRREYPKRWYCTPDGKLTYPGRTGTGMPDKAAWRGCGGSSNRRAIDKMPFAEPPKQPVRLAAGVVAGALRASGDGRGGELFDVDGRRIAA